MQETAISSSLTGNSLTIFLLDTFTNEHLIATDTIVMISQLDKRSVTLVCFTLYLSLTTQLFH